VARELDLQTLSQSTTSVTAFQVLTIGPLGETNLEISIRSFLRHVSGMPNEMVQETEKEKKRKRGNLGESSNHQILENAHVTHELPSKKLRNNDGYGEQGSKRLSTSIESLYESILSAQKELEAGRTWTEEVLGNL